MHLLLGWKGIKMCKKDVIQMISQSELDQMSQEFHANQAYELAANAAVKNGIMEASANYESMRKLPMSFSLDLKQGEITNQKASGRCWIFAALNTFRFEMIKKYNLSTVELSQNYLFFYDKLEKANYYLESVMTIADEPLNGRLFTFINNDPLGDGGQWDMIANLVEKYGIVPKEAYPDAAGSLNSRWFDQYLTTKLREYGSILRQMTLDHQPMEEVQEAKKKMLSEFYRMLCISLGEPPKTFDYTLCNKDDEVIQEFGITPKEFFQRYVGIQLSDYVSLIHSPTEDKPYEKLYTVKFLGNVYEGTPITYLNLPMETIKEAVVAQLKDGHPVWFGSDCMKYSLRKEGIFDRKSVGVERLFDTEISFTKEDYLNYGDSAMNHAMVILGVNLDSDEKPDRWRIENSWGKEAGQDGYYVASDSWFDSFVFQVVVNKKHLSEKLRKILAEQDRIELEPWDPFGTLAD